MSTLNICFYGEFSKIILLLSSSALLICSVEVNCLKFTVVKDRKIWKYKKNGVIILKLEHGFTTE